MATLNPFDLLGDDTEDPSQIAVSIAADKPKKPAPVSAVSAKSPAPSRQLPQPERLGMMLHAAVDVVVETEDLAVVEMTLDEYEKILEEKKKSLQSQTTSEKKVDTKVFESMQQLSNKKSNDEIFIKLGSDKDKHKDDKEEKAKKAVSINEFLKPAEGENHYRGGGHGGGRGRGRGGRDRGGVSGGVFDGYRSEDAPAIGDTAQFPSLGGNWNAMISGYGNLEMASGFFQTALVRGVCESVIITSYA
ncbi:hypothetical protein F2Q70_00039554 [Brassica cretica]|uniref:STM1-like N-terminal domain-containing protein n=1 Tax=Brassica cretica TaxID=69181 RepID=A0A8S9K723_BRACR|nr:hypothetical protein F2Q70_00039554 [Brassica cretica]